MSWALTTATSMLPAQGLGEGLGLAVLVLALLLPVLLLASAYLKLSIVAGLLRLGIGAPRVPSNLVIGALALLGSLFVIAPVAENVYVDYSADPRVQGTGDQTARLEALVLALDTHLGGFLERHSDAGDRRWFERLQQRLRDAQTPPAAIGELPASVRSLRDLLVKLLPAFVFSELQEALQIAFLLILPFWIIDLVVSNVLFAMGLANLSTAAVSLPLKLLLFIALDGWRVLVEGLLQGYL